MDTLISNASTTIAAATGVGWDSILGYMVDNLKLIAGAGLGMFQVVLPVILWIAVAIAIVYLAYRAFAFFRR